MDGRSLRSIDIGRRSPAFLVTPPYTRVRIRRFGWRSYRAAVNLGIPSGPKRPDQLEQPFVADPLGDLRHQVAKGTCPLKLSNLLGA